MREKQEHIHPIDPNTPVDLNAEKQEKLLAFARECAGSSATDVRQCLTWMQEVIESSAYETIQLKSTIGRLERQMEAARMVLAKIVVREEK